MSNAPQHSRQSGDSQRRRSRGGRNRSNQQQDNRRNGDHDSHDHRNSGRAEEFRPQSPRTPRATPVKLKWWQKLLQAVGLYKAPTPPARSERNDRQPASAKSPADARPAKSNTRNARTNEGSEPATGDAPQRAARSNERARGGDRSTVESPRVYVGNLSYDVSEQDLQELFKGIGGVRNVEIVYNRSTHRSKGYGFVEMLHMDEAMRAVEVLHDQPFMGRKLTVSGAKSKGQDEREEREERPERAQRPVVVAPIPAAAVVAAPAVAAPEVAVDAPIPAPVVIATSEPQIQTILETVPAAAVAVEAPVAAAVEPLAPAEKVQQSV